MPPLQTLTPFPISASPSTPLNPTALYPNPHSQSTTSLSPSTPSLLTDDVTAASRSSLPSCADNEVPLLITSSVKDPNPTTPSDTPKGFSSSVQKTDTARQELRRKCGVSVRDPAETNIDLQWLERAERVGRRQTGNGDDNDDGSGDTVNCCPTINCCPGCVVM